MADARIRLQGTYGIGRSRTGEEEKGRKARSGRGFCDEAAETSAEQRGPREGTGEVEIEVEVEAEGKRARRRSNGKKKRQDDRPRRILQVEQFVSGGSGGSGNSMGHDWQGGQPGRRHMTLSRLGLVYESREGAKAPPLPPCLGHKRPVRGPGCTHGEGSRPAVLKQACVWRRAFLRRAFCDAVLLGEMAVVVWRRACVSAGETAG